MSEKRPLEIACSASNCSREVRRSEHRHSFTSPVKGIPGIAGTCRSCGANIIDWSFCHTLDPTAHEQQVVELRKELIRDNYWGLSLPEAVMRKAHKRTTVQLMRTIELTLRRALIPNHPRERRQTPFAYKPNASLITCAQHATGTCCRSCLEKWYGIPLGIELETPHYGHLRQILWIYAERSLEEDMN